MKEYADVHCHLTDEADYANIGGAEESIARARQAGVNKIIVSGFDLPSSARAKEIAAAHDGVYFCAGFQPEELKIYENDEAAAVGDLKKIEEIAQDEKCVGIGEIGLDYHFPDHSPKELQRAFFVNQLRIADKLSLPVVIHSREACADTLAILHENRALLKKGFLMHCFSYAAETVNEFLSLGAYFSFGGVSTFKKAEKVRRAAAIVPKERILTETDSPYLTPEPFRGIFPNEPKNIPYIAANLASLRGENEEEFCAAVIGNAKRLFSALGESV